MPRRSGLFNPAADADELFLGQSSPGAAEGMILVGIADSVVWLLDLLATGCVRLFWDLPRSAAKAARTKEWTIEAATWFPEQQSHRWTTAGKPERALIAQLASQLSQGEPLHLQGATRID